MKTLFKVLGFAVLCLYVNVSLAQNAREASVRFKKADQPGVIADYDIPSNIVEGALQNRLDKANLGKKKTEKGFWTYKAASWPEITGEKVDIYVRVEGSKSKSTIYLLVSKGYDNYINSKTDPTATDNMKNFLNNFMNDVNRYKITLAVADQEKALKKAQDDYNASVENGKKLLSDREKVEKQIAENKTAQDNAQNSVSAEQQKLETLKGQLQ